MGHQSKTQSEIWSSDKAKYEQNIEALHQQMSEQSKKKIESVNKYNVEMNNLRKDKDKAKRKCDKLEKTKKRLKGQIKSLNEKIENITAVTKELVKIKHQSKTQSEIWSSDKAKYEQNI